MWHLASFSVVREHEKCDTFPAVPGLCSGTSQLCFRIVVGDFSSAESLLYETLMPV